MKRTAHNKFKGRGGMRRTWKWIMASAGESYQVEVWQAYIRIGGRQHETSYSIRKHGSTGARALAVAWLATKRAEKRRMRIEHEKQLARRATGR